MLKKCVSMQMESNYHFVLNLLLIGGEHLTVSFLFIVSTLVRSINIDSSEINFNNFKNLQANVIMMLNMNVNIACFYCTGISRL